MKLWTYIGKKVRVYYKDGETIEGLVEHYDDGEDNDDGVDSITLSNKETEGKGYEYDVSENEIEKIEIL